MVSQFLGTKAYCEKGWMKIIIINIRPFLMVHETNPQSCLLGSDWLTAFV